eukprot:TRINITY_DN2144_c0_g1_i1.p2 TRINITY_DN2144_c0_g1~~TRINITY_DN2144_c0_g1_i1.p2  ORF type:complete len:117 (-),score=26.93 TRINITY_DN2144_c0_g1_i1:464-814(-)
MGNGKTKSELISKPPSKNEVQTNEDSPKKSDNFNNKKEEIMNIPKPISDAIDRRFELNEKREKFLSNISSRGLDVHIYDRKGNPYITFTKGAKKGNSRKLSDKYIHFHTTRKKKYI